LLQSSINSTLTLLVPRIFAYDTQHAISFDDFAFAAHLTN
jgi:hypothetical protein